MRHIAAVSRRRPAQAQLEPALQLLGLISSLLQIINLINTTFGTNLFVKPDDTTG